LKTYILQLLPHVRIFMNQLRDLLLKTLILFHKELVHGRQLSVDSLKPRGFLALLITASSVLKPNLDLLWLNVGKYGTLPQQLLAA